MSTGETDTYEANIVLEDGRHAVGTVEAEDRFEAKYFFGHCPTVIIEGETIKVVKVDYRSVRKAKA